MIDLEKEREAFEAKYLLSDKGIVFDKEKGTFFFKDLNLSDSDEQFLILIRKLWVGWLACAESKQAEIDELKAKLEKSQVPEGFVLVKSKDLLDIFLQVNEVDLLTFNNRPSAVSNCMVIIANKINAMIEAAQGEEE